MTMNDPHFQEAISIWANYCALVLFLGSNMSCNVMHTQTGIIASSMVDTFICYISSTYDVQELVRCFAFALIFPS